jgi:hypothetical protein
MSVRLVRGIQRSAPRRGRPEGASPEFTLGFLLLHRALKGRQNRSARDKVKIDLIGVVSQDNLGLFFLAPSSGRPSKEDSRAHI